MANIFNLFGGISDPAKGQIMKPLAKSKTTLGISGPSGKSHDQVKPKGLSMRSNSDLNVPATSNFGSSKQDMFNNKQQTLLKPKITQLDNIGRPISPIKQLSSKKLNVNPIKMRSLSPKKEVAEKNQIKLQKPSDEYIFKKPLPPKKYTKKQNFPEAEKLAPYNDLQYEFDDIYTKTLENEFKGLFKKKLDEVKPYEDEGFESGKTCVNYKDCKIPKLCVVVLLDPEQIYTEIPKLCISPILFHDEMKEGWIPKLPEISDNEDGF